MVQDYNSLDQQVLVRPVCRNHLPLKVRSDCSAPQADSSCLITASGLCGVPAASLLPSSIHSFHQQTCHTHVITPFIYDSQNCDDNKSPIHGSIRKTAFSVCDLTGLSSSVVHRQFTLKPIWSHCALQQLIVYQALISTRRDSSQLPVMENPPTGLKRESVCLYE